MTKKKFIKIVGYVLTTASFIYIFYSLYNVRDDIFALDSLGQIFAICGIFAVVFITTIYAYGYLLKFNLEFISNKNLKTSEPIEIFTKSNLCKYLPGSVMQFVARNIFAEKIGITQTKMAFSSVIEIFFNVVISLLLCLVFAGGLFVQLAQERIPWDIYIIVGIAFCAAAVIAFLILRKMKSFERFKQKVSEQIKDIKLPKLLGLSIKMLVGISYVHIVAGLMFFYLLRTVTGINDMNIFTVLSAYIIAWLIGYITPSAPGGIGVKETILSFILMEFYDREQILVAALLFRVVTITADVLAFCLYVILKKLARRIKR